MTQYYVDSDGVLANLHKWIAEIDVRALKDNVLFDKLMVYNYKDCFLKSEAIEGTEKFFNRLANNPNWHVLTALPRIERLYEACHELDKEYIDNAYKVLKENKYIWFERRGIPRSKVIITDTTTDKLTFCRKGDVLYDDFDKTIKEWIELGGIGIRVVNKVRDNL